MFAVIKTGGKQYLVKEGQVLKIEKIEKKQGAKFSLDKILFLFDEQGEKFELGKPYLKDAEVKAEVLEEGRGKKVSVIKYKPKVRYRKNVGHRQPYTKIKILEISGL
jgi:large subunit ribosomal protein L21